MAITAQYQATSPLFASVTVPRHIPVLVSIVDNDAPPMTTSSSGEKRKKFWKVEDEGVQSISPGPTNRGLLLPFFPPPIISSGTNNGGFTKLEHWRKKRRTSHGSFRVAVVDLVEGQLCEVILIHDGKAIVGDVPTDFRVCKEECARFCVITT
jgi:hypothetical protein